MSTLTDPSVPGPKTTAEVAIPPSVEGSGVGDTRRLALALGSVVPGTPYRLVRWLGDGGMGAVFEAVHVDTERWVAVKVLHSRRRQLQWVLQGFRNEARASARIGSPNIVETYDFKELEDGRLLIAMELLEGPTLHAEIDRGPLSWPRIVAIARQICKGLSAAHQAGIVHRDIKPENIILVRRDGRDDFVKLLDFGVAHYMCEGAQSRMSGTAEYMAPEVVEGDADARADIYSLGCVLYVLGAGEFPFVGMTPSDTLHKQRVEHAMPPSQRAGREVPADFDALVLRCLAKDPDQRFQTMDELEAALCELQLAHRWVTEWDDLPVPAVEEPRRARIEAGLRELSGRGRRRARWPVAIVVALLAALAVAWLAWPREAEAPVHDELERHAAAAQQAAARFYFVYPPRDEPDGATAYREVLALEALGSGAALERGAELRREFAATLTRLGDRYWDFEGARPFAYEYYASALVFAEDPHARTRAGLTPLALERLRDRAAAGEFTEHELLALEPLAALAEPDAEARVARLEALRSEATIPASVGATLDRVLQHAEHRPGVAAVSRAGAGSRVAVADEVPAAAADATTGETEVVETTGAVEPVEDPDALPTAVELPRRRQRDPAAARELVVQARAVDRAGDRQRATTLYNRALEADPRSVDALDGLASVAFRRARYGECARHLERAVALGPGDAARWLSLGDAYFKTLRYSDARDAYQRAKDLGSSAAPGRLEKLERKLGGAGESGGAPPSLGP